MTQQQRPPAREVVEHWLELDLGLAAPELAPAFEVDGLVSRLTDFLVAGRYPILVGDGGVGKTALVHELARRIHGGTAPTVLAGKRLLQLSIQLRATELRKPREEMGAEFQRLIEALVELGDEVVPFFRDLHMAYHFDLESQLSALAFRFPGFVIGEGNRTVVLQMFEYTAELERGFSLLNVEEPNLTVTRRIIQSWAEEQQRSAGIEIAPAAVEQSLYLTHRFLARSRLPRKAIELLRELADLGPAHGPITAERVVTAFCDRHVVPRLLVDPTRRLAPAEVQQWFANRVLGQDEAVQAIVRMICTTKAGLSDPRRPFGVFLFAGPTGVGKTYLAQLTAEYLFGSADRMVRMNLGDYQAVNSSTVLFGDPEDGRLPQMRGILTQRLMGHAFAVLLLDELEKAGRAVHDRFLQLIDEGAFINGAGETISCRSMVIIATSNAGAEIYRNQALGFGGADDLEKQDRELDSRLEAHFRLELLNRFDQVVHFHPLSRREIRVVASRELERIVGRAGLQQRGLQLEVDEPVLDWLAVHGYDPDYGARFLRRCVERNVTTAVAEAIVDANPEPGSTVALTVRNHRVVARLVPPPTKEDRQQVALPEGSVSVSRSLDVPALLEARQALMNAAGPRIEALEARQAELADILEAMNRPGFWEDSAARQDTLERYRRLEVTVRVEQRLERPITVLGEVGEEDPRRLARAVEAAAHALREWEMRLSEESPVALWMFICSADPLKPASELVRTLVEMELAWCRRLHLTAGVVAYEESRADLVRAVIEVEGPGAAHFLGMERGIHRLCRSQGADLRAAVDLIPQGDPPSERADGVEPVRRRTGLWGLAVDCRGRLEQPDRGLSIELVGQGPEVMAHLVTDLRAWLVRDAAADRESARTYAEAGCGARDPRTGAVVARFRDVQQGRLDRLLEAWWQRDAASDRTSP